MFDSDLAKNPEAHTATGARLPATSRAYELAARGCSGTGTFGDM